MARNTLLFHLSDIHFGLEDNARRSTGWNARSRGCVRPRWRSPGDLTMRARQREFAAACRWIQALDVPVTVEIGNHDMPYFNLLERFLAPYRRFHEIEGLVEREIDLPGVAIVPLKTAVRAQPRLNWSKAGSRARPAQVPRGDRCHCQRGRERWSPCTIRCVRSGTGVRR
jgi:3',5'-cyclic AMP phosphodiesterase CpdA